MKGLRFTLSVDRHLILDGSLDDFDVDHLRLGLWANPLEHSGLPSLTEEREYVTHDNLGVGDQVLILDLEVAVGEACALLSNRINDVHPVFCRSLGITAAPDLLPCRGINPIASQETRYNISAVPDDVDEA